MYDNIHIALSKLKEKEKIALLLFEIGGFSLEEIRIIQNEQSPSAIKSRLSRAREKLRKVINALDDNKFKDTYAKSGSINNIEMETINIINNIKP